MGLVRRFGGLALISLMGLATACTNEDGSFNSEIGGQVQKGPFTNGTTINVAELDSQTRQTGRTFSSTIVDDLGTFDIGTVQLQTPLVRISADGFYFDEVRGELSSSRLAIFTYADVTQASTINVNLLGHLEAARIEFLVTDSGLSFNEAKAQANGEVLSIFTYNPTGAEESEQLDISQAGEGNAKLLALSVILQGTRTPAELSELLSNIQTDIRADGVLDSSQSQEALMNGARTVNLPQVRANLESRYEALGINAAVPAFEPFVEAFIRDAPYDFTGGITYEDGDDRPNFLAKDRTEFVSGACSPAYGFAATLPPATELRVEIIRTQGSGDFDNVWTWNGLSGVDWTVTDFLVASGSQTFTSIGEGRLDVEEFNFIGTGAATVEYYEYGSETPTFTKDVTWDGPVVFGGSCNPTR